MEMYNYDKSCDCIELPRSREEYERLEDLMEYLKYLYEEIIDVREEIKRIKCLN